MLIRVSQRLGVQSPLAYLSWARTDNLRGSDDKAVKWSKRGTRAASYRAYENMGNQVHWDYGEVREWLNRAVSKTVEPLRVPWVRIPPSPPFRINQSVSFSIGQSSSVCPGVGTNFQLQSFTSRSPHRRNCPREPPQRPRGDEAARFVTWGRLDGRNPGRQTMTGTGER